MPPRILFSSLSAKLALYREVARDAQSFCNDAKVTACDSDPNCAASREVDHFIPLPKISELTDEKLIEICKLHKISHVLPTRDGELLFWAHRKELLAQHNIQVWVSNEECIELCNDKLSFHENWKNCSIPSIPTYKSPSDIQSSRWVVKPRLGSGGKMNKLNLNYHEACNIASSFEEEIIFQPFVSGREFSAEAWISKENRCYGPLLRWRNKVVGGESHQSTVFRNPYLDIMLCKELFPMCPKEQFAISGRENMRNLMQFANFNQILIS